MKGLRFFTDLLFPPRCVSCGALCKKDLLDPCDTPMCDKCRVAWEKEKTETCPRCGLELMQCRCSSARMEKAGIEQSIKLIYYRGSRMTAGRRAILYLKKRKSNRSFSFFGEQLAFPLRRYMKENGLRSEEVLFCYVPRGRRNADLYGLDQAERLCRALSAQVGCRTVPLFYRIRRDEREQKKLSAKERAQNVKNRFGIDRDVLSGIPSTVRCIFLVDDVITTGASIAACAVLLREHRGGAIVGVSLARTPLLRKKAPKKA